MVESCPRLRWSRVKEELTMSFRSKVTLPVCAAVLLGPVQDGKAWFNDGRLSVAIPLLGRNGPIMVNDRPQSGTPFRVAAQGRVEPVSEVLELAIGAIG